MNYSDPQILAIILILPAIFGISLTYEGYQNLKEKRSGWFLIIVGLLFLSTIVGIFYYYNFVN